MKTFLLAPTALALCAAPSLAKGKEKRHRVKDGAEVADAATRKACKAAGGKWEKVKAADAAAK